MLPRMYLTMRLGPIMATNQAIPTPTRMSMSPETGMITRIPMNMAILLNPMSMGRVRIPTP